VLTDSRKLGRNPHFTFVRLAAPLDPGPIVDLALVGHDGRCLLAA
jgi:threonylcarbamoyladenosine tRNA methylthiotransferase MtaB